LAATFSGSKPAAAALGLAGHAIALAAGVALIRYQMGTIKLLLACAIFGLVLSYLP
jgi:hypothetical protein